jgi:hypothetical protein
MTDTTTAEHIAARDDLDLQKRLIAAAEQLGYENAQSLVASRFGALVSAEVEVYGQSTSVGKVHAHAAGVRRELMESEAAMPPGLNPSAVTDEILRAALAATLPAPAPAE